MSNECCRICGINLEHQHQPLAALVAWPPALLPGDIPRPDELCDICQAWAADQ
jgi:hypothetical protein